ncbi:16557_t:CDS:2 [Entrophospora sp. SA101]|nr:16557_t:CDS:2 [Entrophospora sp. SA101]
MSATTIEQMSNNTQVVSWEFVQLYYKTLNEKPEIMKDFYKNQSKLIRGEEGEPISVCQGLKEIDNNILQKKYKDVIVDFTNIDCLEVFEKKILLQVLGSLSNNGDPPRKFVQTVILDTQPNGYYVLQDIFRYLNDDVKNTFDVEEESSSQLVEEINTNDTNNNNAATPTTSSTVNIDNASKVTTSSSPQINTSVPSNKTSTHTKPTSWANVVGSPTATDNKNRSFTNNRNLGNTSTMTANRELSLYVRWNNGGDVNVTHGALLDLFKKYGEIRNFNLVEKKKKTFTDQNLLGSTTIIVEERMSHGGGRGGGDRRNSNSMGRPPSSRS